MRARFGLSQEGLGFHTGLHRNYVGALERGETNPTFTTLIKLARGIDINLSELITLYEQRRSDVKPETLVGAPRRNQRR
jgi:transcriptional regulator with XRE-family HTH domain